MFHARPAIPERQSQTAYYSATYQFHFHVAVNLRPRKIQIVGFAAWILNPDIMSDWGFPARGRALGAAFAVDDASTIL
jgi:hypothetical protein